MTDPGRPPEPIPTAWPRRFPDHRLWAGRLRLWRVELAVRAPSLFPPTADSRPRPVRLTLAFLDLPDGLHAVPAPAVTYDPWPEPVAVPDGLLRPDGTDVLPVSADWRTVPVVAAEAIGVVAVRTGDRVHVFAADEPDAAPLWELPADVSLG